RNMRGTSSVWVTRAVVLLLLCVLLLLSPPSSELLTDILAERHLVLHRPAHLRPGHLTQLRGLRAHHPRGLLHPGVVGDTLGRPFDLLVPLTSGPAAEHVPDGQSHDEWHSIPHLAPPL